MKGEVCAHCADCFHRTCSCEYLSELPIQWGFNVNESDDNIVWTTVLGWGGSESCHVGQFMRRGRSKRRENVLHIALQTALGAGHSCECLTWETNSGDGRLSCCCRRSPERGKAKTMLLYIEHPTSYYILYPLFEVSSGQRPCHRRTVTTWQLSRGFKQLELATAWMDGPNQKEKAK